VLFLWLGGRQLHSRPSAGGRRALPGAMTRSWPGSLHACSPAMWRLGDRIDLRHRAGAAEAAGRAGQHAAVILIGRDAAVGLRPSMPAWPSWLGRKPTSHFIAADYGRSGSSSIPCSGHRGGVRRLDIWSHTARSAGRVPRCHGAGPGSWQRRWKGKLISLMRCWPAGDPEMMGARRGAIVRSASARRKLVDARRIGDSVRLCRGNVDVSWKTLSRSN